MNFVPGVPAPLKFAGRSEFESYRSQAAEYRRKYSVCRDCWQRVSTVKAEGHPPLIRYMAEVRFASRVIDSYMFLRDRGWPVAGEHGSDVIPPAADEILRAIEFDERGRGPAQAGRIEFVYKRVLKE